MGSHFLDSSNEAKRAGGDRGPAGREVLGWSVGVVGGGGGRGGTEKREVRDNHTFNYARFCIQSIIE
jgi:hypothetical protein